MADIFATEPRRSLLPRIETVVDFVERVTMTFIEAFLGATLLPTVSNVPDLPTVKIALGTSAIAVGKFLLVKISAWQAAHAG